MFVRNAEEPGAPGLASETWGFQTVSSFRCGCFWSSPPLRAVLNSSNYSILKALTGFMDAARRAGISPATNAAKPRAAIAPAITLKSALVIS